MRAPAEFERVKLDSEVPREAVYLPGRRPRWLLVTNRRVLLFAGAAGTRKLVSEGFDLHETALMRRSRR